MSGRTRHTSGWRRRVSGPVVLRALVALLCVGAGLAGCDEPPTRNFYRTIRGAVVACQPTTGELAVRVEQVTSGAAPSETVNCIVTSDSEMYINDKISSLSDIQLGDEIELVGYWERGELEKFVVSFASVDHPLPPPARPALKPPPEPTTQATQPQAADDTTTQEG